MPRDNAKIRALCAEIHALGLDLAPEDYIILPICRRQWWKFWEPQVIYKAVLRTSGMCKVANKTGITKLKMTQAHLTKLLEQRGIITPGPT